MKDTIHTVFTSTAPTATHSLSTTFWICPSAHFLGSPLASLCTAKQLFPSSHLLPTELHGTLPPSLPPLWFEQCPPLPSLPFSLFPFLYQFPLLLPFTGAPTFLIVLLHPTYHLFCLYPKFHQEDFGAAWLCTVPKTQAYSAALHSQSINSSKLISHSPEKHKDLTEHHTASAMPRGIGQVPPAGWQAPSQQSRCTGKKKPEEDSETRGAPTQRLFSSPPSLPWISQTQSVSY